MPQLRPWHRHAGMPSIPSSTWRYHNFTIHIPYVLKLVETVAPCCAQCHRNSGVQILYNGLLRYWVGFYIFICNPLLGADEMSGSSQQLPTAICDEGWWSDTLWATLIRLWLHALLCYLHIVVVEISLHWFCRIVGCGLC
jgi:hypothetical protein